MTPHFTFRRYLAAVTLVAALLGGTSAIGGAVASRPTVTASR